MGTRPVASLDDTIIFRRLDVTRWGMAHKMSWRQKPPRHCFFGGFFMACNSCSSCNNSSSNRCSIVFPDFVANSCCNPCCSTSTCGCGCNNSCGCNSCGCSNSCGCGCNMAATTAATATAAAPAIPTAASAPAIDCTHAGGLPPAYMAPTTGAFSGGSLRRRHRCQLLQNRHRAAARARRFAPAGCIVQNHPQMRHRLAHQIGHSHQADLSGGTGSQVFGSNSST